MGKQVLEGLRVIDFGQYIPGPLASMMLSDYGAEVIHVDPIGGPMWNNDEANAVLMRGKKNICLNLKKAEDLKIAIDLIKTADVVVENFRPGVMDRLGIGHDQALKLNPRIVYCSIPGFSSKDERHSIRGWEGIVSAEAGVYQAIHGKSLDVTNNSIIFQPLPFASIFAASMAVHSIIAALICRNKCGKGQWIETSMYDACFELEGSWGIKPKKNAEFPPTPGKKHSEYEFLRLMGQFPCKDGRYVKWSPPVKAAKKIMNHLLPAEFFQSEQLHTPEIDKYFANMMMQRTSLEWEIYAQNEFGAGMVKAMTTQEWLHDLHALTSRSVVAVEDYVFGKTIQPGLPAKIVGQDDCIGEGRHKPDQDRESIIEELKKFKPIDVYTVDENKAKEPILKDVKIVDFCQVLAGPIAGRILAEYGADIIKVNPPLSVNSIACHEGVNNGKLTTLIDFKTDEGRKNCIEIIKKADVFHCNFAQKVYGRIGFGIDDLKEINPNIIISQLNVHSIGGWRENERGHEELGESSSGMGIRYSGSMQPGRLPIVVCDHLTGQLAAIGIMLALYHKQKTGEALHIHTSLSRTGTIGQIPYAIEYADKVWNDPSGPNIMGWSTYNRLFHTTDEDIFVYAMKKEELIKNIEEFKDIDLKDESIEKILERTFKNNTSKYWVEKLNGVGIDAVAYRNFFCVTMDEEYANKCGLTVWDDHVGIYKVRNISCNLNRFSLSSIKKAYPVASPGYDTDFVVETIKDHWPTIEERNQKC